MKTPDTKAIEGQGCGIVLGENYKFLWGHNHGYFINWPNWIKKMIVSIWNLIACKIWGHSYLGRRRPNELPTCCDCCQKVKPTLEQEKDVINEW